MKTILVKAKVQDAALQAGLQALEKIKHQHAQSNPHRSLGALSLPPFLLLQIIFLPLAFCGALFFLKFYILKFWQKSILFFCEQLAIPFVTSNEQLDLAHPGFQWSVNHYTYMPDISILWLSFFLVLLIWIGSFWLDKSRLPLKYLVRIMCTVQVFSLLFFFYFPNFFPYTILSHSIDLIGMGYVVLVASPVMLSFGYYVLKVNLLQKIMYTLYILGYFLILVPCQVVLHMLILQHFSLLFLPVLYIFFGMLFDVLIFIALYSQVVSKVPA
ncbi:hypothetical protein ACO0LB_14255 [Undibacterium sp. SXout7W]|uniref:hypothetical protein n=1 Tax=Undibacterium sp. SXout7W TaxID=3413049 RepID=UPI003BF3FF9B